MKNLYVSDIEEDECRVLPEWAEQFILMGKMTSEISEESNRKITLAFAVPTRHYAALFFLLGFEAATASKYLREKNTNSEFFMEIAECKDDEPLLILDKNRWKRCWFKGIELIRGMKCIKVEIPCSNTLVKYIPEATVFSLRRAVDPDRIVTQRQKGFQMNGLDSLVNYYGKREHEMVKYLTENQNLLSSAFYTNKNLVKSEIDSVKLNLAEDGSTPVSLQHLLRFDKFMTEFDLPRSLLMSEQVSDDEPHSERVLKATIYDGSLAYINHHHDSMTQVEITFLVNSDPQFSNARDSLMARYYDRYEEFDIFENNIRTIEYICFTE